jgi:hypothetical protein
MPKTLERPSRFVFSGLSWSSEARIAVSVIAAILKWYIKSHRYYSPQYFPTLRNSWEMSVARDSMIEACSMRKTKTPTLRFDRYMTLERACRPCRIASSYARREINCRGRSFVFECVERARIAMRENDQRRACKEKGYRDEWFFTV